MILTKLQLVQGLKPPQFYGYSYIRYESLIYVFYPYPLNWVIRYTRMVWFSIVRMFDRVGLIDTARYEPLRWNDFFRIKSH